jgi:uncharacterized membrane protein YagU involved in acid resistance
MASIVTLFTAGICGTLVMTTFLLVPRWMGVGKIDVMPAVGSLIRHREQNVFMTGLLVHLGMGLTFAFVYAAFLELSRLPFNAMTGAMLGGIHGVIVMLLVAIVIMEHHPVARYHEKGLSTGLSQLVAHILYGLTVGMVVGMMH